MDNKDLDKEIEKLKKVIMDLPAKDIIPTSQIKEFQEKLNKLAKKLKDEIKIEYIWLDGYKTEPNLRSKTKVINLELQNPEERRLPQINPEDCPMWSFDGSSTQQAEGNNSDCLLKPV